MTLFRSAFATIALSSLSCGLTDAAVPVPPVEAPPGILFPSAIRCVESRPIEVGGKPTGFATCGNGLRHRPEARTCPYQPRPLSDFEPVPGARDRGCACQNDGDCREKPNGSCDIGFPLGIRACHYGCSSDSDCAQGQICECKSPAGRCVPASCRTDRDCKDGAVCGEYSPNPGCFLEVAYACQTPLDQCASDEQCRGKAGAWCSLDATGRRTCQPESCMY